MKKIRHPAGFFTDGKGKVIDLKIIQARENHAIHFNISSDIFKRRPFTPSLLCELVFKRKKSSSSLICKIRESIIFSHRLSLLNIKKWRKVLKNFKKSITNLFNKNSRKGLEVTLCFMSKSVNSKQSILNSNCPRNAL